MYPLSPTLSSARRTLIGSLLLLLCVIQFSVFNELVNCEVIMVTDNFRLSNTELKGTHLNYNLSLLEGPARFTFALKHFTRPSGASLTVTLNSNYNSPTTNFPPLTVEISDFTMGSSMLSVVKGTTSGTTVNITKGISKRVTKIETSFLVIGILPSPDTIVYVSDITASWTYAGAASSFVVLQMYKLRGKGETMPQQYQTGFFVSGITATGVQSIFSRDTGVEPQFGSGTEHWDVVAIDNSVCESCKRSFFMDRSDNVIENGLLRFQNCQHKSSTPFYVIDNYYGGSSVLYISTNGNLIFSNVTSDGPLFGYTAQNDGEIYRASRLTLHNITAKSLYPTPITGRLFKGVYIGLTQVYMGPLTFGEERFVTKEQYATLRIGYTRLIDETRKVVHVNQPLSSRSLVDFSEVGEFSASHCVYNGYTGVTSQSVEFSTKPFAQCVCAESRYLPHCTTVPDPFREGKIPTESCSPGTTMSHSLKSCVECNVPNCARCDTPNVCAVCDEGTVCTIGGDQDTSKSIPWWVWLIVGLAAAVVVGLILFFIMWCCCCKPEEFVVIYEEDYKDDAERNGREVRLWEANGEVSTSSHGPVIVVDDSRRPRTYKQDKNNVRGDTNGIMSSVDTESWSDIDTSAHSIS